MTPPARKPATRKTRRSRTSPKETDLYPPLKCFLESQGYTVKGEIHECDVVAVRGGEEPVVVELKLSLNLSALLQAVQRLSVTSKVYIGVDNRCPMLGRQRRHVLKLLRMLGLGLVMIDLGSQSVAVILDPGDYKPRKVRRRKERLLGEFQRRVGDPNAGGMDRRRGIMTAYRQRVLAIAGYLQANGPTKASDVAKALEEPKARAMLYGDVYGWFERPSVGIYDLSPRGRKEIAQWLGKA
jgi:hypothetical protein